MATPISTIKNWFLTDLKPTQAQFWAMLGSFWHKDESIPISKVSGLSVALEKKATSEEFEIHLTDTDAHAALLNAKEDKLQKGVANGYVPLDAFIKIGSQYLNIINDLVTGGATAILSAEQGKLLQNQINAINTLLTSDNVDLDNVQELVDAIETVQVSLSTILVNDLTTGGTTKALTAEMGKALKVLIDALLAEKQAALVSGVNIKTVNGVPILGAGNLVTPDMDTTSSQFVLGLKTFLDGRFSLRNVADTFSSFYRNSNTASRTYNFQDRDGTVADLQDIAAINTSKMNTPAGATNFLSKFLTASTIGLSRLFDNGTFFGIGTVNAPTKDITLGNQGNREIGIEESENTIAGRDLTIRAGRTINYANALFNPITTNNALDNISDIFPCPNGDIIFLEDDGQLFVKENGSSTISYLGTTGSSATFARGVCTPDNNIYIIDSNAQVVKKQTNRTGAFATVATGINGIGICISPSNDVWLATYNGIFKQTNQTGSFVNQGFPVRNYEGICSDASGKIYVGVMSGDVYTIESGVMTALGQTLRRWYTLRYASNGDIVAVNFNESKIFKRVGGSGNFIDTGDTLPTTNQPVIGLDANNSIYLANFRGNSNLFFKNNNVTGTANLNGGTFKQAAGTGKGTGRSRVEIYTGQKTSSGTDMQVETLREYIDENGYHVYISIPSYVNDAAADADTNLPSGAAYKLTGNRTIFHKP